MCVPARAAQLRAKRACPPQRRSALTYLGIGDGPAPGPGLLPEVDRSTHLASRDRGVNPKPDAAAQTG